MLSLLTALLLSALYLVSTAIAGEATLTGPADVVDGDTLKIGGIGVRLKGISVPEMNERGRKQATEVLRRLIGNRQVTCKLTGETTRGRGVGYCEAGGKDLQEEFVRGGYVMACPKYTTRYVEFEAEPRARRAGVWSNGYQLPRYCEP